MIKIIFLLLILLSLQTTYSAELKIENLPAEYRLLVQDWAKQVESEEIEAYIARHESVFRNMSKEDRYSLVKVEVYRFLIRNRPELPFESLNSEMISKMVVNSDQIKIESFSDWVFAASITDIKNILKNKKYIQLKNSEKKRLRLAASWPFVIFQFDKEYFENSLNKLVPNLIKAIEDQLMVFSKFSNFAYESDKDLRFFTILKKISKKKETLEKSEDKDAVVEIVDEVEKKLKELPRPVKNWIMPSDLANELSPLKKFKKDENYIAPSKLPEATDDWLYGN